MSLRLNGRDIRRKPMIIDLSGKRAIVTGGTGGIGLAIAAGLAKAGARVVITGREQGRVDAALGRLREATGRDDVAGVRSEEHTSELQSLMRISYAVFCLKKKTLTHISTEHS